MVVRRLQRECRQQSDVINDQTAFFNWNDMSQNNRNAVQGTLDKMAVYQANALGGKATIKFDAADTLDLPSTPGTKMVFAVMKQDSTQSAETSPFGGDLVGTTSGGKWGIKRSGVAMLDSAVASNAWAVIVYKASAGDYAIYVNGVEKVTGTGVTGISALDKIGGTFKGEIAEVVAYDRVLPNLAVKKSKRTWLTSGDFVASSDDSQIRHCLAYFWWGSGNRLPTHVGQDAGGSSFHGCRRIEFRTAR